MAKPSTTPAKVTASYKIGADLLEKAKQKCRREAEKKEMPVTLSGKIEELVRAWVNEK